LVVSSRLSLAALALGALAVTNSWDFPTYLLLLGGALLGRAWLSRRGGRQLWAGFAWALATTGGLALVALLLDLPFFQNYVTPAGVRGLGLVRDASPLGGYLLIYGLFLAILVPWIAGAALRVLSGFVRPVRNSRAAVADDAAVLGIAARPSAGGAWRALRSLGWSALIVFVLVVVAVAAQPQLGVALGSSALLLKALLLALLLGGAVVLAARRLPRAAWFVAWLAVVAWAVSLGVELVYIRDHLEGGDAYRMNTVFKFGLQAWMLLALAAAAALPSFLRALRRLGPVAQGLGWAVLLALLALSLVFPLAGIPSRVAYRFPASPGPTLDGLAFMQQAEFDAAPQDFGLPEGGPPVHIALRDDLAAIRWLNANIDGTPIVLQSDLWFYRAYGTRIAANTGLPTVVSPLHASEQHDPQQVSERDLDVQQIYRTLDAAEALRLLSKYHVGYVYAGQIERAAYGAAGLAKFDQMANKANGYAGSYLDVVYRSGSVTIYKVNDVVYVITPDAVPAVPPIAEQPNPDAEPPAPAEPQPPAASEATTEELEQQVKADPTAAGPAFELAQRYRDQKRLDDAAGVLAPAASAHPQDVALHQLLGDILRDGGHQAEAEAAYRAAVAADPSAGNYNKLGVELLKWGLLDQAAEAFQQAIAADANAAEPYYHLGEVYERQGQLERAAEQYRAYLTIAAPDAPFRADATEALKRVGR
jgi:YYY domain-containing protein